MYKRIKSLFLICETPLHAGSGSDLGIVDLPIQRERHTSYPKVEASSLKGALREALETKALNQLQKNDEGAYSNKGNIRSKIVNINRVFGYDEGALKGFSKEEMNTLFEDDKKEFAGCIGFTDARILLFPIKSMKGVFAWVTCPRVLHQLEREMNLTTSDGFSGSNISSLKNPDENHCYILGEASKSDLTIDGNKIILEEYAFTAESKEVKVGEKTLQEWMATTFFADNNYWNDKASNSIVVLNDNDFKDFVNLSTEVITRTKIDNVKGTVADGQLFTEEYLPAESVLYSLVMTHGEFSNSTERMSDTEAMQVFEELPKIFQLGGNATLGKGLIRTVFLNHKKQQ